MERLKRFAYADGMNLPNVRRALIGLAVAMAACTGPAGLGDLGTNSPFGPEAPVPTFPFFPGG